MPIVFQGNEKIAYRDPACYYDNGKYHLFFTVSEKENGYMFNRVAYSMTEDMEHFTEPVYITEKDNTKNFCSPGNVIKHDDEYLLCVTSYPMPYPFAQKPSADDTARLFFIKTKNFLSFSAPERIYPKGENNENDGRMIDPFVFRYQDE